MTAAMLRPLPQCPVATCRAYQGNVGRNNKQRWYQLDSNRHLLVGQLDEALAALPCNDHICSNCYKRIRRLPPPARNLLDKLTAAPKVQPRAHTPLTIYLSLVLLPMRCESGAVYRLVHVG